MDTKKYVDYIMQITQKLLAIDSPTGYTAEAVEFIRKEYEALGYPTKITTKGGLIADLGGKSDDGLLLAAHTDTLGGMVCEIKDNGRLRVSPLGGMNANNAETENVRILTKFDGVYEGTFQLDNASLHVNGEYNNTKRDYSGMEVVIDMPVKSAEDTRKLGIENGDIICFDPRTVVTKSGYIKSRFLDDKLSVGILLGCAKYLRDEKKEPARHLYHHITVYEEVGHGGAASLPDKVTEMISVDMGCVGDGLRCDEHMVSICAKDSMGPYDYNTVKKLIETAKKENLSYAVDVYPFYGSDVDVTLKAGYDIKHALIGAGVYASHGYERSHRDGAKNTFALLAAYVTNAYEN